MNILIRQSPFVYSPIVPQSDCVTRPPKPYLMVRILRNLRKEKVEDRVGFGLGHVQNPPGEACRKPNLSAKCVRHFDPPHTWVDIDRLPAGNRVNSDKRMHRLYLLSAYMNASCSSTLRLGHGTVEGAQA